MGTHVKNAGPHNNNKIHGNINSKEKGNKHDVQH